MKRAKHNLSHYKLFSADMGKLYPIGCLPVLPGDTFQQSTSLLVRLSPMVAPVMHPIQVRIHHFFVPNRLVWTGWEDFITGGPDGDDVSSPPTSPRQIAPDVTSDYLGVPPVDGLEYNNLSLRAYNLIWNEFFRDQDLEAEEALESPEIHRISWEKDYFTTARPWTQKGPQVTVPIAGDAPIRGLGIRDDSSFATGPVNVRETAGTGAVGYADGISNGDTTNAWIMAEDPDNPTFPGVYADLSQAESVDINEFRKAFALQRYAEARARYGSRYTEYLRYLGVKPSDARLQRPEFLGGGTINVSVSEVLQTAPESNQGQPPGNTEYGVGDLYGHGIAATRSNRYRRFFEEHGHVMTLMSVRPKSVYIDGMHREFLKKDREDFFQRELAHIGQQPIYNSEVYGDATAAGTETFGYQDRYDEYRKHPSNVAGEFREELNYWHMGRKFSSPPVLNSSFVQCDPTKRIFNVQDNHVLWCMAQHRVVARRMVGKRAMSRII